MIVTDVQKSIVRWFEGNLLVMAAAGSGKTFVFVNRIAFLIRKHGVAPENILALTLTKNAAEQMRSRLAKLVGKDVASKVTMSTFHSFAYSQLKKNFPMKYKDKAIIADWFKIRTLYDVAGEKKGNNPHGHNLVMSAAEFSTFVSYQKSLLITDKDDIVVDEKTPYATKDQRHTLQSAYETYCKLVRNSNSIEFDDMIMDFAIQLETNKEFLDDMKDEFRYIMVDEFQDTNNSNSFILQKLNNDNLMVVGDVNQSIYSFINSDVEMIVNFEHDFNDVTVKRLESNYRSSNNIVKLSNMIVMASDNESYKKYAEQVPAREDLEDREIVLTTYQTEQDEVKYVSESIDDLITESEGLMLSDITIISRTNATLGMFESSLADLKIPVNISGGRSFFDRKEIADILSYAKHAIDETDDMSLRRIFNAPNRFISKKVLSDLDAYAYDQELTLSSAINKFDGFGRNRTTVLKLANSFEKFRDQKEINASKFLRLIYNEVRYEEHLNKTSKTYNELMIKKESVGKLFDMAKKFRSVKAFLAHVSIIKDNNNKTKNAVNLMTVHASKGLEFKHVFGVGVNAESYPHEMTFNEEEERRLLYVMVSRAIENLYLSTYVFKGNSKIVDPSPFMIDAFGDKIKQARKEVSHGSMMEETVLMDGFRS